MGQSAFAEFVVKIGIRSKAILAILNGMFRSLLSLLLLAAALEGSVLKSDEKLSFSVISSRSIEEPPTVQVTFHNGIKDDLDLEHYKMHETAVVGCNYVGKLKNDPSAVVAVTGCLNKPGDKMEVTMISKNNINKMFSVDFNGNAEVIENPFAGGAQSGALKLDRDDGWRVVNGDEEINDEEEDAANNARTTSIPAVLKATIQFGYGDGLNSELGTEGFDAWVQTIFTHTQTHYRHAESLGTTIEFEVVGNSVYNQGVTWTADDNIYDARDASNANSGAANPDMFAWFCSSGGGGVAGIAFVEALCSTYHTSLNEKQHSAAGSGFVLAHELGHNFGVSHDFDESHGGHDGPCNGHGIMSYGSYDYDQWSTCSRSDWEQHYASRNWGDGCLEDISDQDQDHTCASGFTLMATNEICGTQIVGSPGEINEGGPNWPSSDSTLSYSEDACAGRCQARFGCTHYMWFDNKGCRTQTSCDQTVSGYTDVDSYICKKDEDSNNPATVAPTEAPGPEVCFDVTTHTQVWAHEIQWNIGGSTHDSCENEKSYENHEVHTQQCCLSAEHTEFAITCKDAYGDGWHGGYLEINGEQYCANFTNGDEFSEVLPNPNPEAPDVCTPIKLVTKRWGNEISWTFGACSSSQEYGNHNIYTEECCQKAGSYPITCKDSYGDGWHGGYLEIEGTKYCKEFRDGGEKTEEGTMEGDGSSPTEAPTGAPPTTECGINPGAIVGGSEVTPYSLPWQVGLVSPGSKRTWCGGTLIGPQHVLTAAHCMVVTLKSSSASTASKALMMEHDTPSVAPLLILNTTQEPAPTTILPLSD